MEHHVSLCVSSFYVHQVHLVQTELVVFINPFAPDLPGTSEPRYRAELNPKELFLIEEVALYCI